MFCTITISTFIELKAEFHDGTNGTVGGQGSHLTLTGFTVSLNFFV